ncbi:hypothetical protein CSAL01_13226 [Colletotrichum salicis]|uniref:Myb-like domain-containing protein n=1 Tax=Colletotrichum salicis TaxID=1209931 RepID=A0A135V765_9PEZI|nr:hypothetical protein CSAL01_13226 [Colletotrichum salicis]
MHDVQSFAKLYQDKERKRQKRQRQLEEQQKHRETSTSLSTALATPLEQDVGALILTETQASGYTSGGLANSFAGIDDFGFNFIEVFNTAELYNNDALGDTAHTTEPFAPISKIGSVTAENTKPSLPDEIKSPVSWSTYTPELAQPPTEPNSQEVATASSRSEQPLALDLVRRSTEQLRLTGYLSDMNAYIARSKEKSKTSDTGESCDNNGSAKDGYASSYDNNTESESCPQQLAVPEPNLTSPDSSGITTSHILTTSTSGAPDSTGSPLYASSPITSLSINAAAASLDVVGEPQTNVFALPTPSSDHAAVSQEGGDTITSWRKRGCEAIEDSCESHNRRLPKRRKSRDADMGTVSQALPARTLRALPSRVLKDKLDKRGLITQSDRQLRRSSRSQAQSHAAISINYDNNFPYLNTLPALEVDHALIREKRAGRLRRRSPTTPEVTSPRLNHSSGETSAQRSGQDPLSPIATTADPSSTTCHTCGFSAEYVLRMSDTVQALIGSGVELSGSQGGLDMLQLFLGFVRDYATRLPHNATTTGKSELSDVMNPEHALKSTVRLPSLETVNNNESSDDNSGDDSDSDSANIVPDHSAGPDIPEEKGKRPQRRRWTSLDELRLRAWVQEGKEWPWIARKLQRSEQAIIQHWAIMGKQDTETTRM